jgi:citrate/tricarballylate utilization protein
MPSPVLEEAGRVMAICNACRYCEGFCAVFPAMELRRTFSDGDLTYLANLCHDCRGCYYACQYAPPHEFGVNVPATFAELRLETYGARAWPRALGGLLRRNGVAVTVITAVSVALVLLLTFLFQSSSQLFATHVGEGAFYVVIPYGVMVLSASAIGVYALTALALGGVRFWRDIGGAGEGGAQLTFLAVARVARDAAALRYLGGAGDGCNYPNERFSHRRKWFHHLVFYGFLLDIASTTTAAFYHHVRGIEAPYPVWSAPVLLGMVGGVGLLVGTAGLLWLKRVSDASPAYHGSRGMDLGFLVLLLLTSSTGLLLLALRETAAMGMLLAVHLGVVAGLFLTLPYGKMLHAVFRSAALVRYAVEQESHGS